MKEIYSLLVFMLLSPTFAMGQEVTSSIRGEVHSADPTMDIFNVSVQVVGSDPVIGTVTDADNRFRLDVPVGRQVLEFRCMGFETRRIDVLVYSGRALDLDITLDPTAETLEGIEVVNTVKKNKPLNPLSYSGARTFSTEETFRFAGSLGDPARMARSFAGVTPVSDNRNDIIVRGNAPTGLLWRIDGYEIPNPNHFNVGVGMTGGQVTLLNTNMMENSDFHLGAWPATLGNALSGVFDINYGQGNRFVHQMFFQMGFNGVELGAEGPISNRGTYKLSYRYSIPDLMNKLGLMKLWAVPKYHDFTLKADYRFSDQHRLDLLTILGRSKILIDTRKSEDIEKSEVYNGELVDLKSKMYMVGMTHTWQLSRSNQLSTRASFVRNDNSMPVSSFINNDPTPKLVFSETDIEDKYSLSTELKSFLSSDNRIVTGLIYDHYNGDYNVTEMSDIDVQRFATSRKARLNLLRGYGQYEHHFGSKLSGTAGLHAMWLTLNNSFALEPRAGLKYLPAEEHEIALSTGLYSMKHNNLLYFVEGIHPDGSIDKSNHDLGFTKSAQANLSYSWSFAKNWNIKLETYFQYIYDAPEHPDVTQHFSTLTPAAGINYIPRLPGLKNIGKGKNYGVEMTLERYFDKHFYLLFTATAFRSLFFSHELKDWFSTPYDGRYVFNLSTGYEYNINKKFSLFADAQATYAGGSRYNPILLEESIKQQKSIEDWSNPFCKKVSDYARLNLRIGYRSNHKKWSDEMAVDLQNLTNRKNVDFIQFDPSTGSLTEVSLMGFMPMVTYRIYFTIK